MMCKIFIFCVILAFVFTTTSVTIASRVPLKANEDTFEDAEKAINSPPLLTDPFLSPSSSVSENNQRIINGNEAQPHSRTYQAGLIIRRLRNGFETQHICGGAVLASNIILTTGFCIEHSHTVVAVLGAHHLFDEREKTQQRFTLTPNEYIFHPAYDSSTMSNDIALLRLPRNALFNEFVQAIELPAENMIQENFIGASVDVAGWGRFSDWSQNYSSYLKFSTNYVVENQVCKNYFFAPLVYNTTLCLETFTHKSSACRGDHGSPITFTKSGKRERILIGVSSFGTWFWNFGCEPSGLEVYANVNVNIKSYVKWIQNTISSVF